MSSMPGVHHSKPPSAAVKKRQKRSPIARLVPYLFIAAVVAVVCVLAFIVFGRGGGATNFSSLNANASPAVAYANGKEVLRTLSAGGLPCSSPSVSTMHASAVGYDYGQTVACHVNGGSTVDDRVTVYVATPSLLGRKGMEIYRNEYRKAVASTTAVGEASRPLLFGRDWFATGDESVLIRVQAAIGGTIVRA